MTQKVNNIRNKIDKTPKLKYTPRVMKYSVEKNKGKAVITLTIDKNEIEEGMKKVAEKISKEKEVKGFRKGKAPYEVIKEQFGEMALFEQAAEELIRAHFVDAMLKENLNTVGQPYFNTEVFAPGNDILVTAEIALFPEAKKLADYKKPQLDKVSTTPSKEDIDQAKADLARMQTKEVLKDDEGKVKKGDKAVVSLTMKKDGVVLEGGEGQDHAIYTAEGHYIPGIVDEILGLKKGDNKSFTLPFPEDHYQKHLAGQPVDFEISIKEVYGLEVPEIDDAFAKNLGLKDAKELEGKLEENLRAEKEKESIMEAEQKALDYMIENSTFGDIPDILVNQEIEKMVQELKHNVEAQGIDLDDYLKRIDKSLADLKLDFSTNALKRIKASIVVQAIAEKEDIKPDPAEIDSELDKLAERYGEEQKEMIYSPQYRNYFEEQMKNKKVVEFLIEKLTK